MNPELQTIQHAVQHNCHVADAGFAADYTLCIYLLKMREFYRWESQQGFADELPQEDIGQWLRQREELWESLEDADYQPISVDGEEFDPFDTDNINAGLLAKGFVYSGGLGFKTKPHFFLGRLERQVEQDGYRILITSDELARDLTAPPAMSLGKTIFIRRESLRRMVWEKVEQWDWNKLDNPMGRAIAAYDFKNDLDNALNAMTANELDSVLRHEIGEIMAGRLLGGQWEEMLLALPRSKAELMVRSVRDHLADALSTLPNLLEKGNEASIHFYMGNMVNMRKELFPSLRAAYDSWLDTRKLDEFSNLVSKSEQHWLQLARQCLDIFDLQQADWIKQLESLIEANPL